MNRPLAHRPFSDGSMTVETEILASFDNSSSHIALTSPFSFHQSLPSQANFEQYMVPQLDRNGEDLHPQHDFHSRPIFDGFGFSQSLDNPEPPIRIPLESRSRSQSFSQASYVGKVPTPRLRPARKLSMADARSPSNIVMQRRRSTNLPQPTVRGNHLRTMSQDEVVYIYPTFSQY